MRCAFPGCKRKIKMFDLKCKYCEKIHCCNHRLTFEHECDNNEKVKIEHMNNIQKQNEKIVRKKVEAI